MDLATNLLVSGVIGFSGFVIGKFMEFDLERVSRAIGLLSFVIPFLVFMLLNFVYPSGSGHVAIAMMWFFANNLPGIIVGSVGGIAGAKIAAGP
jgi:hypothetical protein